MKSTSLVLLGGLLLGCPSLPRPDGGIDSGPVLTIDDFCRDQVDGLCRSTMRCSPDNFDTLEGCKRHLGGFEDSCQRNAGQAVRSGRARFDVALATACLSDLAEASCAALGAPDASCNRMLVGQVAAGKECFDPNECAAPNACRFTSCPGTCEPWLAGGSDAGPTSLCEPGTYVHSGRCRKPVPRGESCAAMGSTFRQLCELGSYCADDDVCRAPLDGGSPCLSDACVQGFACGGLLMPDGKRRCMPYRKRGERCSLLGTGFCRLDSYCDSVGPAVGICQPRVPENTACGARIECELDLRCAGSTFDPDAGNYTQGICARYRKATESCAPPHECEFGTYCLSDAGAALTCAPSKQFNGSCSSHSECKSLNCTGGRCAAGSLCEDPR